MSNLLLRRVRNLDLPDKWNFYEKFIKYHIIIKLVCYGGTSE